MFNRKTSSGALGKAVVSKIIITIIVCIAIGILTISLFHGNTFRRYISRMGLSGVSVLSFTPTGEVDPKTNITIEFTHDMVEKELVGLELDTIPVKFNPSIPGRFKWVSTNKLCFYPLRPLTPATGYEAIISPDISSLENRYIRGTLKFQFHTSPLKVLQSYADWSDEGWSASTASVACGIEFNYKVNPVDLIKHLIISLGEKDGGLKLQFNDPPLEPSEKFVLTSLPITKSAGETKINITVLKGLMGIEGSLGIAEDYMYHAKIEDDLKIFRVASQELEKARYISIEFSSPVDPKLATQFIKIEPSVEFKIEPDGNSLKLKGEFKVNNWYTINISKGLAAVNGRMLKKNFTQKVKIGHLSPSISFQSKGIYLPRKGSKKIAVESTNVNILKIEIEKVYLNNLTYFLNEGGMYSDYYYGSNMGRMVYDEKMEINAQRDETIITPIDLSPFYDKGKKGLFQVSVRDTEEYWTSDSMMVMITDLGIISNIMDNDMYVWVNSLSTMSPVDGAEIKLISNNNQLIATGYTNNKGFLVIRDLKAKLEEEEFIPYAITAQIGEDMSFLRFEDCRMPTASFDVSGRKFLSMGYEAFIYADRDMFRPNDKANIVAVIRGANVSKPKSFPVKLQVLDPRNRVFDETLKTIGEGGLLSFSLIIPEFAMTGEYIAKLLIGDDEIGRMNFFVEDFMPDKTKIIVSTDKKSYKVGEKVRVDMTGQYLFGPPASNMEVESGILIKSNPFSPTKWSEYTFGDEDRKFEETESVICQATLDENGKNFCETDIPLEIYPSASLKGIVSATLKEYGGRAVTAYTEIDIHPYPFYIGIKAKKHEYAEIGKPFEIDFTAVSPDGKEIKPGSLEAKFFKIIYNTVLRRDENCYYQYISERKDDLQTTFSVNPQKTNKIKFTPDDYGRYKITLSDPESRMTSAIFVYASGWGYAPWSMENPARIEIEVEKKQYKAGENAKILIKSPFPGKLLLVTQREKVFDYTITDMSANTATMEIPIKANYLPNVYVTATVIKSLDEFDGTSPLRAFGITPVMVDASDRKLNIEITSPKEIRPGSNLDLNINIQNRKGDSYLTVAAVDEGILQLSDFKTPDPFEFFYGKRSFTAEYCDTFSFILPEFDKLKRQPAGDGYEEETRKKHLSPVGIKRVEPVSLWSDIVKTDKSGNAKISFKVPQFQGRLRIMAVAINESNTGSQVKDVFVRDRIVIDPTLPRFLTSKDEFFIPVTLFNGAGKDGKFDISIKVDGPVNVLDKNTQTVEVKKDKQGAISFKCKVGDTIGKAAFEINAYGAGEKTQVKTNVPVRPSSPVITKTGSNTITEKNPIEIKLPAEFVNGTENVKLVLSALPELKFSGSIQYLLRYPHGCLEQTTSRVFPLLYFENLAKTVEPELFKTNSAWYFVEEGIDKIIAMQQDDGTFSLWPDGLYINNWTSIYASHFLVEARKAGFEVPESSYKDMISWLEYFVKNKFSYVGYQQSMALQNQVYACYVLSLAGKPPKSTISFIRENKLNEIPVSSQFQIAFCYYIMGDKKTALELLPKDVHPIQIERETGGNFNSSVRENAIMLDVTHEISPNHPAIPVLLKRLSDSIAIGRWGTTQENSFALMAIGKALGKQVKAEFKGEIAADGKTYRKFDNKGLTINDKTIAGKTIKIAIKGTGECYAYWQAWGVPLKPEFEEYDKGISVRREFLDIDGNPINHEKIQHGELLVVKITARALDNDLENVIIDDMLPSGLEIENPRLVTSAEIPWVAKQDFQPNYMDIRDDRLLIYTPLWHNHPITFYYVVRAVTRGSFFLPPVSAECMYDATYTSVQSSGAIKVIE